MAIYGTYSHLLNVKLAEPDGLNPLQHFDASMAASRLSEGLTSRLEKHAKLFVE